MIEQVSRLHEPEKMSGTAFEQIVFENSIGNATGTLFEGKLERTADQAFPDIIDAGLFGVEVKKTSKDKWTSTGNSVLESRRTEEVQNIYMFFGKLGGVPDVKFKSYEECLEDIVATHHPRYTVNMNLPAGASIFDKMDVGYEEIRKSTRPIKYIRDYYKTQLREGDSLWWVDDDQEEQTPISPIIKSFGGLSTEKRAYIMADIFIRFPGVLSTGSKKFERVATYLVAHHGIVSSALRDKFTAGGVYHYDYLGNDFTGPHIIGVLIPLASKIFQILETTTPEQLANYWEKQVVSGKSSGELWLHEIDKISLHMGLETQLSALLLDHRRTGSN